LHSKRGAEKKHLLILRHGQAAIGGRDYVRLLTERGRSDVQNIGDWLRQQDLLPEMVIASAAQRTTETAHLCCAAAGVDIQRICCKKSLYHAASDDWLAELAAIPAAVDTVMFIGHNPTLSWLVSQLSATPIDLSPANLVYLTVESDWGGAMKLQKIIRP